MQTINKALTKASKTYAKNVFLRGLVNFIPYVGGALDIVFSEKWNNITQRRIEDFMDCVKQEFAQIEESKINKEFIESDDFADLTIKFLISSARTRHHEKISLFAGILRGATTTDEFDMDEFEEILPTFELVSVRELLILKHLSAWEFNLINNYIKMLDYSEVRKSATPGGFVGIPVYSGFWDAFVDELIKETELKKEDIEYLLQTASQKGLFAFGTYEIADKYDNGFQIKAGRQSFDHTMQGKLTPLFKRMEKYILTAESKDVALNEQKNGL